MMTSQEITRFRKKLIAWYDKNKRDLPWRATSDPYCIWVSEVMLQQTQVNTVIPYYHRFIRRFKSIQQLSQADLQDVLKLWEGLGYYGRARNLHRAAQMIVQEFKGEVPNRWELFRRLPGVGDYIAAAVLSIAFNQAYAVVDGNVKRVLARLFKIDDPVNGTTSTAVYRKMAEELLDHRRPGSFNQALMELGATICRPRRPACAACPLSILCKAYQSDCIAVYPKKIKKAATPQYRLAVGVVFKNGKVLITQRQPDGLLGGLWEFPGGKIEKGETAETACIREIKEEINLTVRIDRHLTQVKHAYTHFKIIMEVFCCTYLAGRVRLNGPVAHRWIRLPAIDNFPVPKANHKFIPKLKEMIQHG
jgi:A/G-specific adenine glycosylase